MEEIVSDCLQTCKRCNHTRENKMFRKHKQVCRICDNEADAKNRQKKKLQMQEDVANNVLKTCTNCNQPQPANMFGIARLKCNTCYNEFRRVYGLSLYSRKAASKNVATLKKYVTTLQKK